jgi:hypothetical protein
MILQMVYTTSRQNSGGGRGYRGRGGTSRGGAGGHRGGYGGGGGVTSWNKKQMDQILKFHMDMIQVFKAIFYDRCRYLTPF